MIQFLDDPMEAPSLLVEPRHDPIRAAFVPYASGLLVNETKSHLEWLSTSMEFSWMNEEWDIVEDLYSYWPFLHNSAGVALDSYYFAYEPTVVCALVRVSDNSFFPSGVATLVAPPGLELAEEIEGRHKDKGLTRLNMAVVPLELVDIPHESLDSVVYYWWNELQTLDWSATKSRMDTLLYWANYTRGLYNDLVGDDGPSAADLFHKTITVGDALTTSAFLADIRGKVPGLPPEATIEDISRFFRTGDPGDTLGFDPDMHSHLNAILNTYPEDIQERLESGVVTSLDPKDAGKIGAGYENGESPSREGRVLLTYEELCQPRP